VAEALLKKLRPDVETDSAGIDPAIPISEAAKKYLAREAAQNHLKRAPEDLAEKELDTYDLVVTMKPKHRDMVLRRCPECEGRTVIWDIDDPYFLPHGQTEKIFKQILKKVKELANSL